MTRAVAILAMMGAAWGLNGSASADSCLQEAWDDGTVLPMTLFPNWYRVRVASDALWMYDGLPGTELIRGITVANFGTAVGSDFTAVYVDIECGATNSGFLNPGRGLNRASSCFGSPSRPPSGSMSVFAM